MKSLLSNKAYDVLKWVALVVLPALAVLYATLGQAWGLPYVDQIVITINAIAVFLGALLGISSVQYAKAKEDNNEKTTEAK